MIILRLIHVLSAIVWVGTLVFTSFYLLPALRAAGPAAGPVMAGLQKRGFILLLPVTGVLTVLSGAMVIWMASGGNMSAYAQTSAGRTFTMAGGLAIIAFLLGITLSRPVGTRLLKLGAELAATPEGSPRAELQSQIAELQRRLAVSTMVVTVLALIAASGMAIARYL
jgi:hypothetical protein